MKKASWRKLACVVKSAAAASLAVKLVKYQEEWEPVSSLGLTRRVKVSEEYLFRHQKIQPLAAPGCYPDPAQSASVCALDHLCSHGASDMRHGRTMVIGREDHRIIWIGARKGSTYQ
jgi:hypothetical protein